LEAQKAFDQGNYKSATHLAQKVQDGANAEVSAEAQALLERMRPPPLTKYLLFLSFMLLVFVTLAAYRH